MRLMMSFVCRQLGPTTPMFVFGFSSAWCSSSALIVWLFPLWRHHRAAVNWFCWNCWISVCWYVVGWKCRICVQNCVGSIGNWCFWVLRSCCSSLLSLVFCCDFIYHRLKFL